MDHDDLDGLLLDEAADVADELLDVPEAELGARLREVVQRTLRTSRPDGTWPPTDLLAEVLHMYLELLDERCPDGSAGEAWVDAIREAVTSPTVLQRMLDEIRAEDADAPVGIPRHRPPDDLPLVIEP